MNLEEHSVGIVILSGFEGIHEGMVVTATGKILDVPVGESLLGRVVDPLGNPIDGKGEITAEGHRPAEFVATGVMSRKGVHEPMATGIKAIDALVPIGRGQRELHRTTVHRPLGEGIVRRCAGDHYWCSLHWTAGCQYDTFN